MARIGYRLAHASRAEIWARPESSQADSHCRSSLILSIVAGAAEIGSLGDAECFLEFWRSHHPCRPQLVSARSDC
jgi:hypothetical protein